MNLQEHIKKVLREETKEGKYIDMIEDLTEEFKNKDCVCDININYDDEDDMYSVYVVTSTECMSEKFDNSATFILRKINRIRHDIKEEIKSFLPIENIYVGSYGKPNCGWSPLNESEESKQEMKDLIKKNTLYSYKDMEKKEDEEPGWIEDTYMGILQNQEHKRVNDKDRDSF